MSPSRRRVSGRSIPSGRRHSPLICRRSKPRRTSKRSRSTAPLAFWSKERRRSACPRSQRRADERPAIRALQGLPLGRSRASACLPRALGIRFLLISKKLAGTGARSHSRSASTLRCIWYCGASFASIPFCLAFAYWTGWQFLHQFPIIFGSVGLTAGTWVGRIKT